MQVVFRPAADADLLSIAAYIAERDPDRALSFVERLRTRCLALASQPHLGRPRPEFGDGIRSLWEKPYVLLYRVAPNAVEVLAIVHGARDLPTAVMGRLREEES